MKKNRQYIVGICIASLRFAASAFVGLVKFNVLIFRGKMVVKIDAIIVTMENLIQAPEDGEAHD